MEQSKAYDAEQAYVRSMADSSNITYALVKVKNGDAGLEMYLSMTNRLLHL